MEQCLNCKDQQNISKISHICSAFYDKLIKVIKQFVKKLKDKKQEISEDSFLSWIKANQSSCTLLLPPLSGDQAVKFLKDYLLGDDWFVSYSGSSEQVNTDIVYAILERYSKKFKKELKIKQRQRLEFFRAQR